MLSLVNLKYKDFQKICRFCFNKIGLKPIDEVEVNGVKIVNIFENVFHEKIPKDEKPQNICSVCVDLLMNPLELRIFSILYYDSKKALENLLRLKKDIEEKLELPKLGEIKYNCKQEIQLICNFCDFNFTADPSTKNANIDEENLLEKHTRTEHLLEIRENKFWCIKCEEEYPSLDEIRKHFFSHKHRDKRCHKCGCKFNTIKQCFIHTERYKDTDFCLHCKEHLQNFESVIQHYNEKHKSVTACMLCNQICLSHMKLHLYSKHRPHRMRFCCLKCFVHFETYQELFDHKTTYDHSVKKCEICNETYTGRKDSHVKKNHQKSKIGICDLCGKVFKHQCNLKRHFNSVHFGKKFKCPHCPKSLTTRFHLKHHIVKKHTEDMIATNSK